MHPWKWTLDITSRAKHFKQLEVFQSNLFILGWCQICYRSREKREIIVDLTWSLDETWISKVRSTNIPLFNSWRTNSPLPYPFAVILRVFRSLHLRFYILNCRNPPNILNTVDRKPRNRPSDYRTTDFPPNIWLVFRQQYISLTWHKQHRDLFPLQTGSSFETILGKS